HDCASLGQQRGSRGPRRRAGGSMRLSEWRKAAPHKDAGSAKLAAVGDPARASLGAESDPHAWVAWGEEPGTRYTILVVTDPGLISCFVRLKVAGEGPGSCATAGAWAG